MMKRLFLSVCLSSASVCAFAAPNVGSFYGGVSLGQAMPDTRDNITVYGVVGGYQVSRDFALEANFFTGSKTYQETDPYYNIPVNVDLDLKGMGVYGAFRWDFPTSPIYFKSKIGVNRLKADATASNSGYSATSSDSETKLGYGLGLGTTIKQKVDLTIEFTEINSNLNMWGLTAAYRF